MATQTKDFKVKNGLIVGDSTNIVNYTSSSPSNPFIGQIWVESDVDVSESGGAASVGSFNTIKTIPATEVLEAYNLTNELSIKSENGIQLNATASVDQLTISTNATWNNTASAIVMRDGVGSFDIGAIDFDIAASVTTAERRLKWDDGEGTLALGLKGGNINLDIGQETIALCYNGTGSAILKGSVVYISSAQGQRPSIALANATSEQGSSKVFGLAAEEIANGAEGFVATFGVVAGINTSGLTEGAVLWLSASAGKVTTSKPLSPTHLVFVGYCLKVNSSSGRIFVNPQNGYELEELHDVLITSASNNNIISYNSASSLWINKNILDAIKEVDGSGSGIDADLLDSHDSSYFLNTSSATQEKTGTVTFHGTVNIENLVITGSATTITSNNLALTDSLVQLAYEQYTTDAVDIGIVGSYGDGTTSSAGHYHASFARDASQNKWKLLSNGPAPVNNVIDYTDPSVEFGVLQLETIEVSSSAVVTNLNADMLDGYNSTYFLSAATASSTYAPLASPALTGTPTAPTATADTNTTQIATTAYVIGQGYLKSSTASSTYIPLSTPTTGTASIVYSNHPTLIRPLLQSPQEIATISATAATASINYDVLSQTVLYYTSSAIGNWHLNVRGNSTNTLSSLLEVGESVTLVFGVDQGTTAYYQLNLMIDGTQVVPRWQGGSAPTGGNTSGTDIYSYTIVKTAATPTYRVFAALTGFA